MNTIILSFGSNIGEREESIKSSYDLLQKEVGKMRKHSSFFETVAWGFDSENLFINSVAEFATMLSPFDALDKINAIEYQLGRRRSGGAGYENRPIDIDILFYNDCIIETKRLVIPHPLLHLREFVLMPLKEIEPEYFHPILKKKIKYIAV